VAVHVEGLAGLQRGFRRIDKNMHKELRTTLQKAAEPVRADAARRTLTSIPNIKFGRYGRDWSEMRTGVTTNLVYVAPRRRGRKDGSPRPNLANLLMDRAMAPALEAHADDIERDIGEMLDDFFHAWERF
jgi:hypothetical protein